MGIRGNRMKNTYKHETKENLDKFNCFLSYDPKIGVIRYTDTRYGNKYTGEAAGYQDRGYLRIWSMGRNWFYHRLAWALYYGEWPKLTIDHINGNKLDNRLQNLRVCSNTDNMKNRKPYSGKPFKGVYKNDSIWNVQISSGGRSYWVGSFQCLGEALRAYDAKARKLHGEYARLNLPTLEYQNQL